MNMFTEYVRPKTSTVAFKIGCYAYLFTGVGHLTYETSTRLTRDPAAYAEFTATMPVVNLLGRNLAFNHLTIGFSFAMGLLLMGFGLSFLLQPLARRVQTGLALAVSVGMLLLSIQFFFVAPITTMAIATFAFLLALGGE